MWVRAREIGKKKKKEKDKKWVSCKRGKKKMSFSREEKVVCAVHISESQEF